MVNINGQNNDEGVVIFLEHPFPPYSRCYIFWTNGKKQQNGRSHMATPICVHIYICTYMYMYVVKLSRVCKNSELYYCWAPAKQTYEQRPIFLKELLLFEFIFIFIFLDWT